MPPTLAFGGADEETRTLDPRITSAVLYQLSYIGALSCAVAKSSRILGGFGKEFLQTTYGCKKQTYADRTTCG